MILADEVLELLGSAQRQALIAAPFVRSEALARLLDAIPLGIDTTIVTRWRPLDLLAGASDLDVLDVATAKPAALLLRNDLHAKLFAADDVCLVGSANVTNLALGWRAPANFELLVPVSRTQPRIAEFEKILLAGCVLATEEHRDSLKCIVDELDSQPLRDSLAGNALEPYGVLPWNWFPRTRTPEDLYIVYCGGVQFSREILRAMQADLHEVGPARAPKARTIQQLVRCNDLPNATHRMDSL